MVRQQEKETLRLKQQTQQREMARQQQQQHSVLLKERAQEKEQRLVQERQQQEQRQQRQQRQQQERAKALALRLAKERKDLSSRIEALTSTLNVVQSRIDAGHALESRLNTVVQGIRREIAVVAVLHGDALAVRLEGIDEMLQEGQRTVQESKEQWSYFRQVLGEGGVMNNMDLVHMFDGKKCG